MTVFPNGFQYVDNFITATEEECLVHHIQQLNWQQVELFGQIAKRRVVHFGMDYHYGRRSVAPIDPAPSFLQDVITKCATFLKVHRNNLKEILITEYPINAGIGWHRDAPVFEFIIGISLNNPTPIYFRKRAQHEDQIKLILEPRSAYTLTGEVRWEWEHRIAPVKELRYSITLRTLRDYSND